MPYSSETNVFMSIYSTHLQLRSISNMVAGCDIWYSNMLGIWWWHMLSGYQIQKLPILVADFLYADMESKMETTTLIYYQIWPKLNKYYSNTRARFQHSIFFSIKYDSNRQYIEKADFHYIRYSSIKHAIWIWPHFKHCEKQTQPLSDMRSDFQISLVER